MPTEDMQLGTVWREKFLMKIIDTSLDDWTTEREEAHLAIWIDLVDPHFVCFKRLQEKDRKESNVNAAA